MLSMISKWAFDYFLISSVYLLAPFEISHKTLKRVERGVMTLLALTLHCVDRNCQLRSVTLHLVG